MHRPEVKRLITSHSKSIHRLIKAIQPQFNYFLFFLLSEKRGMSTAAETKALERAEKAAAKQAARDAKAAERAAAKAEREEAKAEGKEKIAAMKQKVAANKLDDDATAEDIVAIIANVEAPALLKLKAVGQITKNKSLYPNNMDLFHKNYGDMLKNGGNINSITNLIIVEKPEVCVPYLGFLIEELTEVLKQQYNLSYIHQLAKKFPAEVWPHADNLLLNGLCKGSASRNRNIIIDILVCCKSLTTVNNISSQIFSKIIQIMEMAADDNTTLSHALQEICNMKESLPREVLSEKMVFLETAKDANKVIFTTLQDYLAGRSLEKVATKVDEHEERLNQHEAWLKTHEERLNTLAKNFELSEEKMAEMTEKISNLAGSDEQTAAMLTMLDEINSVMQEQVGAKREDAALEAVLSIDPYNRAFYDNFRSELTATYLAAKSVQTDIVKNSKTGDVGAVGDVLQAASAYIPVIGAGVAFFGAVLGAVDAHMQSKMVKRFADLAVDTEDMNKISRGLGSILIQHLDRESINKPESLMDKCKGLLSFGMDVVGGNLGDGDTLGQVAASTASNYVEGAAQDTAADAISSLDFKSFFGKKKPAKTAAQLEAEEAKTQGADDAGVVANVIISLVYSGKVSQFDTVKERLVFLQRYALKEFGDSTAEGAMPSSESTTTTAIAASKKATTGGSAVTAKQEVISDDEASEDEAAASSMATPAAMPHPQQAEWASLLTTNETIIAMDTLNKPNPVGIAKSRQLILTDGPRLFYCDAKSKELKGTVEWTAELPPSFKKLDISTFELVVQDRSYKFIDTKNGSDFWQEKFNFVVEMPARLAKAKQDAAAAASRRHTEREARNKSRADRRAKQQQQQAGSARGNDKKISSTGASANAVQNNGTPASNATPVVTDAPAGCCTIS